MSYRVDENGNYVRTVRCGYCYEQGHNKGSCKQKKQNHKDMIATYEKEIAEGNFGDDWERTYAQRQLDRHKEQLNKTANRGKNRKCSYCRDEGHTRRTCSFRKGDMNSWAEKCIAAREKFVENMTAAGFGIGALGYRRDHWGSGQILTLVQSVKWNEVTHNTAIGQNGHYNDVVVVRNFQPTEHRPNGRAYSIMLPSAVSNIDNEEIADQFERRCFEIVSPAEPSIPEDFLTLKSALDAAKYSGEFEENRPYRYHGIEYDD